MRLYIIAVYSLIGVATLNSAYLISLEFAEIQFNLFVPLCDCNTAAPIPKLEASHIANVWPGSGIVFDICFININFYFNK